MSKKIKKLGVDWYIYINHIRNATLQKVKFSSGHKGPKPPDPKSVNILENNIINCYQNNDFFYNWVCCSMDISGTTVNVLNVRQILEAYWIIADNSYNLY